MSQGHILVDFDATLATYEKFEGPDILGEPVPAMVERVKGWLKEGRDVRIFTARASSDGTPKRNLEATHAANAIRSWCKLHLGQELPITTQKTWETDEIWDDRAVQVEKNTGKVVGYSTREEKKVDGGKNEGGQRHDRKG